MPLLCKFVALLKPERIQKLTRTRAKVVKTYGSRQQRETIEIDFTCYTSCLSRQRLACLHVKGPVVFFVVVVVVVVIAFGMW